MELPVRMLKWCSRFRKASISSSVHSWCYIKMLCDSIPEIYVVSKRSENVSVEVVYMWMFRAEKPMIVQRWTLSSCL